MNPLTEVQLEALRNLRATYPDAKMAFIGAAALGFHINMAWRNTADLDLVIAVAASEIGATKLKGWRPDEHKEQRWTAPNGVLVDLVPAPADALAAREIVWPATKHRMNLGGIGLALDASTELLGAELAIAIPSVPVIALLKMAAFVDRPYEREKDLTDLAHILNEYPPFEDERVFSDEILELRFDPAQAQALILGRELQSICNELDRGIVRSFLRLVGDDKHWGRFVTRCPWHNAEHALERRIAALTRGFNESGAV